jgi:hypothetical protein
MKIRRKPQNLHGVSSAAVDGLRPLDGHSLGRSYVLMRTTVELPPDLLRRAKVRAAERGESLEALLTRAVAAELGREDAATHRRRVALPLVGDPNAPPVQLTNADLARAMAADEPEAALGARAR